MLRGLVAPIRPKDELGRVIPVKAMASLTEGVKQCDELIRRLHAFKRELMAVPRDGIARRWGNPQHIERSFKSLVEMVRMGTPYTSCPVSNDCDATCRLCGGTQWVTKLDWDNTPRDVRGM